MTRIIDRRADPYPRGESRLLTTRSRLWVRGTSMSRAISRELGATNWTCTTNQMIRSCLRLDWMSLTVSQFRRRKGRGPRRLHALDLPTLTGISLSIDTMAGTALGITQQMQRAMTMWKMRSRTLQRNWVRRRFKSTSVMRWRETSSSQSMTTGRWPARYFSSSWTKRRTCVRILSHYHRKRIAWAGFIRMQSSLLTWRLSYSRCKLLKSASISTERSTREKWTRVI